jgi:NTE family protein
MMYFYIMSFYILKQKTRILSFLFIMPRVDKKQTEGVIDLHITILKELTMIRSFFRPGQNVKRNALIFTLLVIFTLCSCSTLRPPSPPPVKPAKIAVVLGGGGAKGYAHIGVLKVLEAQKIPIHMIVGTSAGSIVGSLFASGKSAFELQEIALSMDKSNVIDYEWKVWSGGLIKGDKLENFINAHVKNISLENLKIPFFAIATNISTGEEIVFARGNTGMAVRASCSVPAIFQPFKIGKNTYVDGGVVSPVAVDVARRNGADVVIAVDISGGLDKTVPEGSIDSLKKSVQIMYARIAEYQIKNADVVIRPNMRQIGSSEMDKFNEAILEGEKAATLKIPELQNIIEKLKQEGRI